MEDSLFIYTPSRLQLNIVLLNCIKYIIRPNRAISYNKSNSNIRSTLIIWSPMNATYM